MSKDITNDNKLVKKRIMYSFYSLGDTIKQLEEYAREGLLLEKVIGGQYYFKKVVPCNVRYSIETFSKASCYDTIPAKTTREFIDYCEEAGWNYICSAGKNQFFYTTDENVVPIETDPVSKIKMIKRVAFIPEILVYLLIISMLAGMLVMNRIIMPDVYNYAVVLIKGIDDYKFIYIGAIISIFIAVIKYSVFYIRNKKRIGIGLDIQYFSSKQDKIR